MVAVAPLEEHGEPAPVTTRDRAHTITSPDSEHAWDALLTDLSMRGGTLKEYARSNLSRPWPCSLLIVDC